MEAIIRAAEVVGLGKPGVDFALAKDVAASEFFNYEEMKYVFNGETLKGEPLKLTTEQMIQRQLDERLAYPIISIEDGLRQDDPEGWKELTRQLGETTQLVGDDLFCTNLKLLLEGIDGEYANSILIKVNQIGTLTESMDVIQAAQEAGYNPVISHRSGETKDTTISHIAVATNAGQAKIGSLSRTDRIEKYNELMRIEEHLEGRHQHGEISEPPKYAGATPFAHFKM